MRSIGNAIHRIMPHLNLESSIGSALQTLRESLFSLMSRRTEKEEESFFSGFKIYLQASGYDTREILKDIHSIIIRVRLILGMGKAKEEQADLSEERSAKTSIFYSWLRTYNTLTYLSISLVLLFLRRKLSNGFKDDDYQIKTKKNNRSKGHGYY